MSSTRSWFFGVVVITSDSELLGCELEYNNFCFWKERLSLILNSNLEKLKCLSEERSTT